MTATVGALTIAATGFKEADIGIALSISGLSSVTFQIVLFPPLQVRIGTVPLYRALMSLWPIVYVLFPIMSWCAREKGRAEVWTVLTCFLILKSVYDPCPPARMMRTDWRS